MKMAEFVTLVNRLNEVEDMEPSNIKLKRLYVMREDLTIIYHETTMGLINRELLLEMNKSINTEIERTGYELDKSVESRRNYF